MKRKIFITKIIKTACWLGLSIFLKKYFYWNPDIVFIQSDSYNVVNTGVLYYD